MPRHALNNRPGPVGVAFQNIAQARQSPGQGGAAKRLAEGNADGLFRVVGGHGKGGQGGNSDAGLTRGGGEIIGPPGRRQGQPDVKGALCPREFKPAKCFAAISYRAAVSRRRQCNNSSARLSLIHCVTRAPVRAGWVTVTMRAASARRDRCLRGPLTQDTRRPGARHFEADVR